VNEVEPQIENAPESPPSGQPESAPESSDKAAGPKPEPPPKPFISGAVAADSVRLDRWLCATRLYKSRASAGKACAGGLVKLNGESVKPSHGVRRGDEIRAEAARGTVIWSVTELAEKRLAPKFARLLYDDHSPPPPPKEERFPIRERGAGRPTKHERRALARFRGGL
jgi:ribosome-associated heat shock protein Hsp15